MARATVRYKGYRPIHSSLYGERRRRSMADPTTLQIGLYDLSPSISFSHFPSLSPALAFFLSLRFSFARLPSFRRSSWSPYSNYCYTDIVIRGQFPRRPSMPREHEHLGVPLELHLRCNLRSGNVPLSQIPRPQMAVD